MTNTHHSLQVKLIDSVHLLHKSRGYTRTIVGVCKTKDCGDGVSPKGLVRVCTEWIHALTVSVSKVTNNINNRSFRHASPCLWNQVPKELLLPRDHEDLSL